MRLSIVLGLGAPLFVDEPFQLLMVFSCGSLWQGISTLLVVKCVESLLGLNHWQARGNSRLFGQRSHVGIRVRLFQFGLTSFLIMIVHHFSLSIQGRDDIFFIVDIQSFLSVVLVNKIFNLKLISRLAKEFLLQFVGIKSVLGV